VVASDGEPGFRRIAGRYRTIGMLGQGGMGTVWRVVDETTGHEVALKHADGGRGREGGVVDRSSTRFRREFHTLASLRHPQIVRAIEYGLDPAGPYYTMELLDGCDLKDAGRVPWRHATAILCDVAAALATLHARGLVHRDLAPRNVRLLGDGRAKLFDFGLLASIGATADVAGTATAVAPETMRRQPVDGRTDVFGLGTLAYWLLTGEHAFGARKLAELEALWRMPPAPASAACPGLPASIDVLVSSMLAIDPLARPSSAAEVIDRLTSAVDDGLGHALDVSRGYLASAAMVGREREMALVREHVAQVVAGRGRSIVVEASSGLGKSRVLRELGLEAQLAGMQVIEVAGDLGQAPWGVMQALVGRALGVAPQAVARLGGEHRARIARVFPAESGRLGVPPGSTSAPVTEPAEQRIRVQSSIVALWRELVRTAPLAILVDDLQRCDEASAAVIAALVRGGDDGPLLFAASLRTNEHVRASVAVAAIAGADVRLRLSGLEETDVLRLVESSFGAIAHARRLAHWLHSKSGGSPLLCIELLRLLCDDGTIRMVDGMWMLPAEFDAIDVPHELAVAMDARVASLSAPARAVAEILAVVGEALELDSLIALVRDDLDEMQLFAGLDELIAQAIIVGDGERHHLRHDGLREAVLRTVARGRSTALHLRAGKWLAEHRPTEEARIGWHLREGGARRSGAELLARAGVRSFRDQALVDCIAPLEAALEELADDPSQSRLCLELRFMLVSAGWISDRAAGLRHMDHAVESLRRHGGLALAARLGPWCGRHLALVLGIMLTTLRWIFTRPSRRGPSPVAALPTFAVTIGYACGLEYANHNRAGLERLVAATAPLAVFRGRLLYATHLGLTAFPDLMLGRLGDARTKLERVLHILRHDRITPIGEFERRYAEAGILSLVAQVQITNLDPDLPHTLAKMREHGLRYYDLVAGVTEAAAARFRGLEPQARRIELELEPIALQLGSWSTDVQMVLFGHPPYGEAGDIGNLKRMADELERLIAQGFNYGPRLAMTRGDLARARGEYDAAAVHYETALATLDADELLTRVWVLVGFAEAELALGRFDAALAHATMAQQHAGAKVSQQRSVEARAARSVALAHAGLGRIEQAERAAAIAIELAEALGSEMALGLAHEARARIALVAEDSAGFHLHAALAAKHLRSTGAASLAAVAERVLEAGSASHSGRALRQAADISDDVTSLSQLATSHEAEDSP